MPKSFRCGWWFFRLISLYVALYFSRKSANFLTETGPGSAQCLFLEHHVSMLHLISTPNSICWCCYSFPLPKMSRLWLPRPHFQKLLTVSPATWQYHTPSPPSTQHLKDAGSMTLQKLPESCCQMRWSFPSSFLQLLPISNILIACGSVVASPAEPTVNWKLIWPKPILSHKVSSQFHLPCVAAHAEGNRAW